MIKWIFIIRKRKKNEAVVKFSDLNKLMDKIKMMLDILPWCLLLTALRALAIIFVKRKRKAM